MSAGVSRQRVEQCFRVSSVQDPRNNLEEAEKWACAIRERSIHLQHLRNGENTNLAYVNTGNNVL